MKIKASKRVVYQYNPLVEVIGQMRFSTILEMEKSPPDRLQKKLSAKYPKLSIELQNSAIANPVNVVESQLSFARPREVKIYHFSSEDDVWRISVCSEFFTLTCTKYENWSVFCKKFLDEWKVFAAIYSIRSAQRLGLRYRCIYLHSPAMVAAMRYSLSEEAVNVQRQIDETNLILSSEQTHLQAGRFDIDRMIEVLDDALNQALRDGYKGLWASGDMSWEFGAEKDFSKLLEYEWRLEQYFRSHSELHGVCQYHAETLPNEVMRQGILSHPVVFLNDTLSHINPEFLEPGSYASHAADDPSLNVAIEHLCEHQT